MRKLRFRIPNRKKTNQVEENSFAENGSSEDKKIANALPVCPHTVKELEVYLKENYDVHAVDETDLDYQRLAKRMGEDYQLYRLYVDKLTEQAEQILVALDYKQDQMWIDFDASDEECRRRNEIILELYFYYGIRKEDKEQQTLRFQRLAEILLYLP
ncbi:hypothetical protein lbkm_0286 [Lachnospiraceae bacterium KM106-2]|nr:hypothetical protein lbkm_0286 [Lachnospiraceae bacterium KM106-2]